MTRTPYLKCEITKGLTPGNIMVLIRTPEGEHHAEFEAPAEVIRGIVPGEGWSPGEIKVLTKTKRGDRWTINLPVQKDNPKREMSVPESWLND